MHWKLHAEPVFTASAGLCVPSFTIQYEPIVFPKCAWYGLINVIKSYTSYNNKLIDTVLKHFVLNVKRIYICIFIIRNIVINMKKIK